MIEFSIIFLTVLPVFLVVGLGMAFRRFRLLTGDSEQSLMRLTVNVFYPALIFSKVLGNPILDNWGTVGFALLTSFGFVVIGVSLAFLVTPLLSLRKGNGRRTFAVVTGTQNYGYLAIPIVGTLWGPDQVGLLFVFSLGVEIAVWTLGVALLTGGVEGLGKRLFNGPLVAIVLGISMNAAGADTSFPLVLDTTVEMVGRCAIPIGLLLVGSTLAGLIAAKSWEGCTGKTALGGVVLRMAAIPAVMLAVAICAPISLDLKRIIVVQASMPAAVFPILLARHYGGHPATAAQIVLATTFVSLASMPFVISYGLWLVAG